MCSTEKAMIISFLENLQNDYLKEKLDIEKEIGSLKIHIKENIEFIKLLEETNDPNYESFTPREVNSKNKVKILELKEEQQELQNNLEEVSLRYLECQKKTEELSNVLRETKRLCIEDNQEKTADKLYGITLLETQENERQRISRELHDSTAQNLTSLVHKTELCGKLVEMDPIRCKLELSMMTKTLREIINDTREMIFNLRPMSFDDIGLDVTIERTLDKLENSETKKIKFSVEGEPYEIKPVIGLTLIRIIQEACSNAICHANASLISVTLTYEVGRVLVQIEDDGNGFEIEKLDRHSRKDNSGFGLSMMKERVYLLSGNINIDSKVNYGTRIFVEVPIISEEEN